MYWLPLKSYCLDLKNYLYQVYMQKPEFFKDMQIPLPRSIRLN